MESFRGQGGIQMLLSAEQEAQHIVSTARNLKTTRLKQAREEAEREVTLHRSQLEAEYQKKISETSGNSGTTEKRLDEETERKIKLLKESASKVSNQVLDLLIKHVTTVKV